MTKNKTGMIGLGAAIIGAILSAIIAVVLLNYSYIASAFFVRQENSFRDYQNAAFGANRGVWLIKYYTPASFPYLETVPDTNVTINISRDGATYTIKSVSGDKTLVVRMTNGRIVSWE